MNRVSVAEAARRLGVSQDAVYKRIKRGTIPWEKGAEDKTYVWIEEEDSSTDSPDSSTDWSYGSSTDPSTDPLVDELRDRIAFLERQLEHEQRAHGELRRLLAGALERIPELEAPSEARESSVTPGEDAGRGVKPNPKIRGPHSAPLGGGDSSGWSDDRRR
jgi:hypothetical protein